MQRYCDVLTCASSAPCFTHKVESKTQERSSLTTVFLEDTWEAEDVKEECQRRGIECKELTVDELKELKTEEFLRGLYLCNTAIVQAHLAKAGALHLVPDTYSSWLQPFFRRNISECLLKEVNKARLPLFVKPVSNDKAFDGVVLRSMEDLPEDVSGETKVYVSDVVPFDGAEHRLFVGAGRLYAIGMRDTGINASRHDTNSVECKQFIQSILKLSNGAYCAVDICYVKAAQNGGWAVVEVNPGFALDDCGIDIEIYINYCMDSCRWSLLQINGKS